MQETNSKRSMVRERGRYMRYWVRIERTLLSGIISNYFIIVGKICGQIALESSSLLRAQFTPLFAGGHGLRLQPIKFGLDTIDNFGLVFGEILVQFKWWSWLGGGCRHRHRRS